MRKKLIIGLAFLMVAAVSIGGTVAYFSKSFASDNNTASAAKFNVDVVNADGETIDDGQFGLGDDLYPGMVTREVYSFQINKNDTELPLEYAVDLIPNGDLFPEDGSSPIDVTMEREVDGKWAEVDYTTTFQPESDTESYRILVDWPHGDNDIDFQGATGNMKLEVVATQVDALNEIDGVISETTEGDEGIPGKSKIVGLEFKKDGTVPYVLRFNDGEGLDITKLIRANLQKPLTKEEMAEQLVTEINQDNTEDMSKLKQDWEIESDGVHVIFTSKEQKSYEDLYIKAGNQVAVEVDIQEGNQEIVGGKQITTLTINGDIHSAGTLQVTFDDGVESVEKSIAIDANDTHQNVASKVADAFNDLAEWEVASDSADVVFTAKTAEKNKDIQISLKNK